MPLDTLPVTFATGNCPLALVSLPTPMVSPPPHLAWSQVIRRAVVFTARRLATKHGAERVQVRHRVRSRSGAVLGAVCLGERPDRSVVVACIAAPGLSKVRRLAREFGGLGRYWKEDVWRLVGQHLFRNRQGGDAEDPSLCFPGDERVLALRDPDFGHLAVNGDLDRVRDVCRVTGIGLLRVYRDGPCKWAVVPVASEYAGRVGGRWTDEVGV